MKSKPVNPLDIINQIKNGEDNHQVQPQQKENPVLSYFREKEKNKIEIVKPLDHNKKTKDKRQKKKTKDKRQKDKR